MSVRYAGVILALTMALAAAGCGYHFTGEQIALPEDVHALSVGTLDNKSREQGLDKSLAFAMEREILERGHFHMVEDPGGGDAVLSGTIRALRVRPVAFDSNDQAVQYELILIVDFVLMRQSDGRVLWRIKNLREFDEYSSKSSVVVTSSSQFQQGTLDASDVQNPQLSQIQLSETERQTAITRLLNQTVRDVYNQMVENF